MQERSNVKKDSEKKWHPVHFAELMALCFLKNAELEKQLRKYKGRLVLKRHNIRDKNELQAVFTEKGAGASQMVAAKSFDAAAWKPCVAGSAAECVSENTQVKDADMARLLELPRHQGPMAWTRIPTDRRPTWRHEKKAW